jgi:NAD(P)-dependent dehydrogenase (short-subunit alcohol dehydrogenase family)
MALGLAGAGARVIAVAARERQEIDALAAQSERVLPQVADVTCEKDCRAAVDAALARFGRLDTHS